MERGFTAALLTAPRLSMEARVRARPSRVLLARVIISNPGNAQFRVSSRLKPRY